MYTFEGLSTVYMESTETCGECDVLDSDSEESEHFVDADVGDLEDEVESEVVEERGKYQSPLSSQLLPPLAITFTLPTRT
jgi:hypothetical protein